MLTSVSEVDGRIVATLTSQGKIIPDDKVLTDAHRVRYTFCREDRTVKLYSVKWTEG